MSVQTAHIIADDRERASGIVDRLKEFANIDLRIEHLLVGDFVVSGQIVFERKRADDFAASLMVVFSLRRCDWSNNRFAVPLF
jgi:ERCC4-type nuclease